jgi:hypothetical protein
MLPVQPLFSLEHTPIFSWRGMLSVSALSRANVTEQSMKKVSRARMTIFRTLPNLGAVFVTVALAVPLAATPPGEKGDVRLQASETRRSDFGEPSGGVVVGKTAAVNPESEKGVASLPRYTTDALSAPLANALNRSTEGLRVFELENGGRGMHLEGRFQHALVARVKEDGSLEIVCINHPHEAEALLKRRSVEADPQPLDK